MLILYNVRMEMAGAVDFSAANAKSSAHLRVKGKRSNFFVRTTGQLQNANHSYYTNPTGAS